jgi:IS30 family transposase
MSYTHITSDERDMLQVLRYSSGNGYGRPYSVGRHPSSLYREIDRNASHGLYISGKADNRASKRSSASFAAKPKNTTEEKSEERQGSNSIPALTLITEQPFLQLPPEAVKIPARQPF